MGGSDFCNVGFVKLLALDAVVVLKRFWAVVLVLLLLLLILLLVVFDAVFAVFAIDGLKLENAVVGDKSDLVGATRAMGAFMGAGLKYALGFTGGLEAILDVSLAAGVESSFLFGFVSSLGLLFTKLEAAAE